jgi:hypothetical protein
MDGPRNGRLELADGPSTGDGEGECEFERECECELLKVGEWGGECE